MKKDRGSRTMPLLIRAIDCCSFDDNAITVSGVLGCPFVDVPWSARFEERLSELSSDCSPC